ncbi:MAG: HD-GYP domain-containing protein [Actinobacteria bacterium]|nr:HD-GYP domain-containing protein [Actinomycetota bacterium]
MRDTKLVRSFGVRTLMLMILMVSALGLALSWRVEQVYRNNAIITADTVASAAIVSRLGTGVFASSLDPEQSAAIDKLLETELRGAGIFAVKLWSPQGVLVYSSDPEDRVGASFADDPEVARAVEGEIVSEIIRQPQPANIRQFEHAGPLLEVYAPVEDPASGAVLGIFETYQYYAPIQREVRWSIAILWAFLIVGTGAAYLLQLQMVRSIARELVETEEQVTEVNSRLEHSLTRIEEHSLGTLQALTAAVDAKDSYTASHSLGVTDYAVLLGKRMGFQADEIELLERAALLHDIGKIGVSEEILLRPSKLTVEEFSIVQRHSVAGSKIIESIPFLQTLVPLIRHHHEHWNGRGYPDGLVGEQIPKLARVLAVADAFDAMTSDRPYRQAMILPEARMELMRGRGTQFDPHVVDALLGAIDSGVIGRILLHRHDRASQARSA